MPASWSKDDAELWASLPPETQAKLAERIGQQEVGVNSKFQELATARKATEAQLAEANANRDAYGQAIDAVIGSSRFPSLTRSNMGWARTDTTATAMTSLYTTGSSPRHR